MTKCETVNCEKELEDKRPAFIKKCPDCFKKQARKKYEKSGEQEARIAALAAAVTTHEEAVRRAGVTEEAVTAIIKLAKRYEAYIIEAK